jgi:nicotinamidase-related amidase
MNGLKFDTKRTALVVIDLQKGIASRNTAPYDAKTVIANAAVLADAFRKNNMPVFLVHVAPDGPDRLTPVSDEKIMTGGQMPGDWSDFVEELNAGGSDIIITKNSGEHFTGLIWSSGSEGAELVRLYFAVSPQITELKAQQDLPTSMGLNRYLLRMP